MILHAIQSGEGPPVVLLHGLFGAARNFGAVQRALTPRFKVIALDMRNHGESPHGPDMRYPTLAADVQETLRALGVERSALVGHSMGGKAAMALALRSPEVVARLLVSDIAPVAYQHDNTSIAAALEAIPMTPGLTRQAADMALAPVVKRQDIRAFLLQNLRFGAAPHWPIGLPEIAAAIPDLEGWEAVSRSTGVTPSSSVPNFIPGEGRGDTTLHRTTPGHDATEPARYAGPALFVAGANSDHLRAEHRPLIRRQFPKARFVSVKHAGHWVHADNPAGFLSVLEAFLHDW